MVFLILLNTCQVNTIDTSCSANLEDKCPDSKPVVCDGEFCGCTGDPTNYTGWYPGIDADQTRLSDSDLTRQRESDE